MSNRVSLLSYVNSFYAVGAMPGARHVALAAFDMKLIGLWRGIELFMSNQTLHDMADLGDVLLQTN
jgi:hypothetical protein